MILSVMNGDEHSICFFLKLKQKIMKYLTLMACLIMANLTFAQSTRKSDFSQKQFIEVHQYFANTILYCIFSCFIYYNLKIQK